ncbi:MAG: hypothetical protein LBP52_09075 [Burkholderiaceae bacterium]|jgi:hypothetical protein|nr:hypothetical protein [Burkholderiaceae bacterium]
MKKTLKILFFLSWLLFALISATTPFYVKLMNRSHTAYESFLAISAINLAVRCGDHEKATLFYDELNYIYDGKTSSKDKTGDSIAVFFLSVPVEFF